MDKLKNTNGYTIAEMVIVLILLSLLTMLAAGIIRTTTGGTDGRQAKQEAFAQAQLALDFTKTQIKLADGYRIGRTSLDNRFRFIDLFTSVIPGDPIHQYVITHTRNTGLAEFGGYGVIGGEYGVNELANHITHMDIYTDAENKIMYITVTAVYEGESVTLSSAVSLIGKEARP